MLSTAHLVWALYEELYLEHHGAMDTRDPKANPMFSALTTWLTRFCRPFGKEKWTCGACGKKRGKAWFWTQRVPFRAADMEASQFQLQMGPTLPAFTPVCDDHPLGLWAEDITQEFYPFD